MVTLGLDQEEERLEAKILESRPGLTREELERLVQNKIQELGGIIGKDAALLLVAKELGVPISRDIAKRYLTVLRIRDLAAGFKGVDLEGVLIAKTPIAFTKEGKPYVRFLLTDGESAIWGAAWGDAAHRIANVRMFSRVLLRKTSVVKRKERLELSLSQGALIEVKEELGIEQALELLSRFRARVDVLALREAVEGLQGKIIFCIDRECRPTGLLLAPESGVSTASGWVVVSNYFEEQVGSLRVLKCRERCLIEPLPEPLKIACREDPLTGVTAQGIIACYMLFRKSGGKVFLSDNTGVVSELIVSSDQQLINIGRLLNSEVKILGISKSGDRLKTTPVTSVKVLSNSWKTPHYVRGCLLTAAGAIEVEAALLSPRLKYRCVAGKPLHQIAAWIDDGTATMQAISNSATVLQKLYGIDEQDLCAMGSDAVSLISDHVGEELTGADVLLRGQVIGSTSKLFAIHEVEVIV